MVSIYAVVGLIWLPYIHAYVPQKGYAIRPKSNIQIESVASIIYDLQLLSSVQLQATLSGGPVVSSLSLIAFGTLSSLTPCTLGMLPVTLAYLGKYDRNATTLSVVSKGVLYGSGIAAVYTTLGVTAAAFGRVFGSYISAPIFSLLSGLLYVAMGLSLMGVVSVKFPSFALPGGAQRSNAYAGAFTLGASSALLEAPCTSPILGALLTYLASTSSIRGDSSSGTTTTATMSAAATMALFSVGYASPIVIAGAAGGRLVSAALTSRFAAAAGAGMDVLSAALVVWGTYVCLLGCERVQDSTW